MMEVQYFAVDGVDQELVAVAPNRDLKELEDSTSASTLDSAKSHEDEEEKAPPRRHKCKLCSKVFTAASILGRHVREVHKMDYPYKPSFKCSVCSNNFRSRTAFMDHLISQHGFNLETEYHTFKSRDEFKVWKSDVEKKNLSYYSMDNKYNRKAAGRKVEVYSCHRSGEFKSRGKQIRKLKYVGSNKIGFYCPSEIRLEFNNAETEFRAHYCVTHIGHQCEAPRLRLSKEEKDEIVRKLAAGIPPEQVLYTIAKHSSPETRLAITNSQDLRNILVTYGLKRTDIECNFGECLNMWVSKVEEGEPNPILFYKPAGEYKVEFPDLNEEDFCLGFMNDIQEEVFRTFGHELISLGCTHGKNKQNIQLVSIVVPDDNWESFPVAFLWCNRQCEGVLWHFFQAIHNRIGEMRTKCFMAEHDHPAFYSAWCRVFEPCSYYLLCESHVRDAWSKNAERGPHKIKCNEKREQVIEMLGLLISETDVLIFQQRLQNTLHSLSEDPDTKSFHRYFLSNYAACPELWAACYRTDITIDPNVSIEKWHYDLKYNSDLKGKCGGRLDIAIHCLIKSLRIKFLNELDVLYSEKLSRKVTSLRKAHFFATEFLDSVSVLEHDNNVWTVSSFSNSEKDVYKVKFMENERCHRKRCILRCSQCKACVHEYKCSCLESAVRYNFCEHIHAVCLKDQGCEDLSSSDDMSMDDGGLELDSSELEFEEPEQNQVERVAESSLNLKDEARTAILEFISRDELFQNEEQCRNIISTISSLTRRCEAMVATTL